MTINKNDQRLTAFVLGELPETEAKAVQVALERDADLKHEVEAIRQTVAEIEAAMKAEPMPLQNISVANKSDETKPDKKRRKFWIPVGIATLLFAVGAGVYLSQSPQEQNIGIASVKTDLHDQAKQNWSTLTNNRRERFAGLEGVAEDMDQAIQPMEEMRKQRGQQGQGKPVNEFDTNGMRLKVKENTEQAGVYRMTLNPTFKKETKVETFHYVDEDVEIEGLGEVVRMEGIGMPTPPPVSPARPGSPRQTTSERGILAGGQIPSSYPVDRLMSAERSFIPVPDAKTLPAEGNSGQPAISSDRRYVRSNLEESKPQSVENGKETDLSVPFQEKSYNLNKPTTVGGVEDKTNPLGGRETRVDMGTPFVLDEQSSDSEWHSSRDQLAMANSGPLGTPKPEKSPQINQPLVNNTRVSDATQAISGRERRLDVAREEIRRADLRGQLVERERLEKNRDNSQGDAAQIADLKKQLCELETKLGREHSYRNDPYNSSNAEAYKQFVENEFLRPQDAPFSTFSIDVDTAAYTTMRRYIEMGQRPPVDSVRLEEYANYFKYDYAPPTAEQLARKEVFATHVDVAHCPWNSEHLLARIGIKGKEYTVDERPPLNLVFLIDTSGSMYSENRLPLVKKGLTELVEMLQPKDRVAIVTYAGSSKLALPSVSGQEKQAILDSLTSLEAGGSTAGAAGITTAYEVAQKYYDKNAQNRVILCTDGDFNVGETNNQTLETMIGEKAKGGVFLTILGFGMGNYKDERLKTLSMRGNGNYGYIDSMDEARRLLVEGLTGTLFAIAKDVKIQVDFNPNRVAGYRLLGYENRKLRDEDFHNDKIDAGEIGAGHTVTALYEIVPVGGRVPAKVDESRYAEKSEVEKVETPVQGDEKRNELMFVKLRYKQPDEDKSSLLEYPVLFDGQTEETPSKTTLSGDAQFAAAIALYGMLLRDSRYSGDGTFDGVLELAQPNTKDDKYRLEFIELVKKAKTLFSTGR